MTAAIMPDRTDGFVADEQGGIVRRRTPGVRMFAMGEMQHEQALLTTEAHKGVPFAWGHSDENARSLASAILESCLRDLVVDPLVPDDLVLTFAQEVVASQDPGKPLYLPWLDVHRWLARSGIPEAADLVALAEKVERVEHQILAAVASKAGQDLYVDPELWTEWDVRTLLGVVVAKRRCQPDHLRHFIDQMLDLKFKLYCLLEVDLPAYAIAIQKAGLNESDPWATPQGHITRLSTEATVAVKTRAVWESVMNAVSWFARGRDAPTAAAVDDAGERYRSKAAAFFAWVQGSDDWGPLSTFEPLVTQHDWKYRTPEIHGNSRLRGDFTAGRLRALGPQLQLLNAMLNYIWDHLAEVAAFGKKISYNAAEGTQISVDLT